jgi:hypothetical protein
VAAKSPFDLTDKFYEFVLDQMVRLSCFWAGSVVFRDLTLLWQAKETAVPNFVTKLLEGRKVSSEEGRVQTIL